MSKLELQKVFDNTPEKSYKEKIKYLEDYLISIADGENIVGNNKELVYPDMWKYKHSFADGLYVREMIMQKGQIGFSAIHKHSYAFFLLEGVPKLLLRCAVADDINRILQSLLYQLQK